MGNRAGEGAERIRKIAELNDALRRTSQGGRVVITSSVKALGVAFIYRALEAIAAFDTFTPDNDPYWEHDFGSVVVWGRTVLWKIDYYDPTLSHGSEDPSDPQRTARVMTVMLAEDY